ncbi:C45 family autoproteolytic acyltransferase/hydolase [Neorhizobium galegae]|uniref:C45 family autoproteolytic acyltransferase/hydolase n=1 Tax=Neorhizobium galegae TaxID=399 RepID=UPI00062107A2|nr:C45 family peptidase [Neorhizobium galegae]CDZ60595.1 Peptidase C45 acyl-coenzyme A:6-aminopenicillanic acid acyl-transferase [Neorhizobium galegae bv. orientalis]KAB1121744.1 acyl-CoA--6-aminopenicillanic acid acyltransferase [Neorhizobium galegae]MCQ1807995.1 C45 family peptidase [Neorhizobium galegae]MCQ1835070.1 C45 family peptidase [Neorhizobium galegae]CDZ64960.1 Peptidase C45 acyl-coenzyme A:6-aminopenicillanic acid acyl-transferase [Neorhizobium galegae bv. orientalis]
MTLPLPCPLIEISGTPFERGQQYGEQAAERILKGIGHYKDQLHSSGLKDSDLAAMIDRFASAIEDYGPQYIEEMRGIARAVNTDLAAILLLNARTEILKLARRREKGQADFIQSDGCTGVFVMPSATRDNIFIHAQNWDWKAECAETAIVLKIKRSDGPDIITFTEAGGLARTGFNSAGISISGNYLETDRDYRELGVPLAIIRRKVLEQDHLAMSMQAVYGTRKSASNNMMIGHAHGVAIDFECAPDETFLVHPENGVLVHANHFQSQVALSKLLDKGVVNMPDSLYRDLRVRQLIEPHVGKVTVDTVKTALSDTFESPWSVCRPPRKSLSNNQSATVAMIVMVPGEGRLEVALLPALGAHFWNYSLDMRIRPVEEPRKAQTNAA